MNSVARFTGLRIRLVRFPSTEVLGYFRSSATRTPSRRIPENCRSAKTGLVTGWGQARDFAILSLICHRCTANDLGLRLTRIAKSSLTLGSFYLFASRSSRCFANRFALVGKLALRWKNTLDRRNRIMQTSVFGLW